MPQISIPGYSAKVNDSTEWAVSVIGGTLEAAESATTQNFNFADGIGEVKGMMMILVNDKLEGIGDNHGMGIGYGTPLAQKATFAMIDSESTGAEGNQVCNRALRDGMVGYRTQGAAAWKEYTINNFNTDARVVMNGLSTAQTYTFQHISLAFAGPGVEVKVGAHNLGTGTAEQEIATGHDTHLFLCQTVNTDDYNNRTGTSFHEDVDCSISFGHALNVAGVPQGGFSEFADQVVGPSEITSAIYNDAMLGKLLEGPVEEYTVAATKIENNSVFVQSSASAQSSIMPWMSVSWAVKPSMTSINVTVPTSGNLVVTSPGFLPKVAILYTLSGATAYNTAADVDMSFGLTVMTGSKIFTCSINSGSGTTPQTNVTAKGKYFESFSMMEKGDGYATDINASSASLTSTGISLTLDNHPAVAAPGILLLIG